MKRVRFNYWKLTAVVAVLAITIIAGGRPSTATKQPPLAVTPADLSSEERALAKYFDDFVAYDSECAKLGKQAVLEHIHINPVQAKSDDLKNRLPGLQTQQPRERDQHPAGQPPQKANEPNVFPLRRWR